MARTDTLTNFLTDVAAAIKAKKGDDTAIPAANFDTEITNLPSGGGEGSGDNTTLISLIDRTVTSFEIPEGTTRIGEYAFKYCTGLTSVTIPNSVTIIGSSAFSDCTGLTKINWNAENGSDFSYDNYVFSNAGTAGDGIDVVFGDSVKSIPAYLFYNSSGSSYITPNIKSVTISDSVTSIGSSAFDNTAWYNAQPFGDVYAGKVYYKYKGTMPENTSVEIKDGTKGIADIAFSGCTGLTNITIPNSVTSIGNSTFNYCISLTSVTIGNSVTSIGYSAFSNCTGLTNVTIGNSITEISQYAFSNCSGLTSITVPNSVTKIRYYAFSDCTGLTEIDFSTHTTVPTLEAINAFNNTPANLAIKVPSTLLDEWKAATNWSTYADKIMGV